MAGIFKPSSKKGRKKLIIAGIIVISVIVAFGILMLIFGSRSASEPGVEALSPIQRFFSTVSTSVGDFFSGMFSGNRLNAENEEYQKRIAELELELAQLEDLRNENDRLEELLGFAEGNPGPDYIFAKVVSRNPDNWYDVLVIDRGTRHGVYKNMSVINHEGVIGMVIEAGNDWAKIATIGDMRCSVPVVVERSGDNGIANGISSTSINAGKCEVSKLPFEADILPGDDIVTSGLGGVFPKGLKIGKVLEVTKISDNMQKTAVVVPAADLTKVDYVLVIKSYDAGSDIDPDSGDPDVAPPLAE